MQDQKYCHEFNAISYQRFSCKLFLHQPYYLSNIKIYQDILKWFHNSIYKVIIHG